jgi:hypothetical protein
MVSLPEVLSVLTNYWQSNGAIYMTNFTKLPNGQFTVRLTNSTERTFTVQVSTNFTNWQPIGKAVPDFKFTDAASTRQSKRYYRLVWP